MLAGRRIVLGVTGGVAAFKAAYLARRLVESGAQVRVVMTRSSLEFLGPQTMAAITGTPPLTDLFGAESVSPHTDLAAWAEVVVVAPATAATLARMASGESEDLLVAMLLAFTGPVVVAPAMHTEMWEHPATRRNVAVLADDGVRFVGPARGALAGGDEGMGRMVEPEEILEAVVAALGGGDLAGWTVLVSAGGTREPVDPVRFMGNRSSGKMGNAIALSAARRGARVTLVTTAAAPSHPGITVVPVETAQQMAEAVWAAAADADVAVLAAAVADFRPAAPPAKKLRRIDGPPEITLEPTPDILAGVAAMKPRPFLVGFAAETGAAQIAAAKVATKGVDLLVANDVTAPGAGFGTDTNAVTVFTVGGSVEEWPLQSKDAIAHRLWDLVRQARSH
ncbi:MAG TPA: bifunctional phosphopantothenoylcysteine decarboxylase/phosphopantothenate--cysteine ligase CoaBC [Acidimicrobiia bacterium]|nr:bifunctional phosphopantothenoylcysteine decarboxylase/phosphopantothenate--cysteine ligase CoaBC [Acidimicrobiia bacterium]